MWNKGKLLGKNREVLEPDAEGTSHALSRIGYSLGDALADIIDNSIDANARAVLVRLFRNDKSVDRIVIADDGVGMSATTLRNAMQYGSRLPHKKTDLGKYGIGMKTASFSQCSSLSVVTRSNGKASGRRWTRESMSEGWYCEILDAMACRELLNASWQSLDLSKSGTIVIWDDLEHLRPSKRGVDAAVQNILKRLSVDLGMRFHRFLSGKKVRISLDAQKYSDEDDGIALPVHPLDPFAYSKSGHRSYPKKFPVPMSRIGKVTAEAHIWPPKSKDDNYKLGGGKVSARQGFYFYRNNRLIQAGGWNNTREDDAEPHFSLARVKIDLHPEMDSAFSLNVQKSKVDVPSAFNEAIEKAVADGVSFKQFMKEAEEVYRSAQKKTEDDYPLVPGEGISARVRKNAIDVYAGGEEWVREVAFIWKKLPDKTIFNLDLRAQSIYLNTLYRKEILGGEKASKSDAELLKLLIFHQVRDLFDKERMSSKSRQSIRNCNYSLFEVIKQKK